MQASDPQEIAHATRVTQPTASKILKALAKDGLLRSQRGVKGGYGAREAGAPGDGGRDNRGAGRADRRQPTARWAPPATCVIEAMLPGAHQLGADQQRIREALRRGDPGGNGGSDPGGAFRLPGR
jgi:hypothetical protein